MDVNSAEFWDKLLHPTNPNCPDCEIRNEAIRKYGERIDNLIEEKEKNTQLINVLSSEIAILQNKL